MIRVLVTLSSGRVGGAEQHVLWLAEAVGRARGFEVAVACRPGEIVERLGAAGVRVHPMAFSDGVDLVTPLRLAWLAADFDLVHAHMNRAALYTRMGAALAGRPWVATAHGMTRGLYYQGAARVIAVSEAVRDHLQGQGVAPLTVIPNGLPPPSPAPARDLEELRRQARLPDPGDAVLLVILANLHPNKGQVLAVQALARLPPRLHLLLAGGGELPELDRLLAADPALAARVHRAGVLPSAAAPFEVADLVLVPSQREAFSLVAAEARMRGVPVLVSDVDGLREVVPDGCPAGLRVAGRDPERWAAAIAEVAERLEVWRLRARRAAAAARRRFALETQVRTTLALYAAALAETPR